jgi:CheY-like chemotaxis protein
MKILLVDDSPADVEVIRGALEALGAQVEIAPTDVAAYGALEADGPFDGLVTDLNLGFGTTGYDVARAARKQSPEIAVIYLSGQLGEAEPHVVDRSLILQKPMRLSAAAARIMDYLREQSAGR